MTFDSFTLAQENFLKAEDRVIRDFGLGASKNAQVLIQRHISQATSVVVSKLEENRRSLNDFLTAIRPLAPELIALVALQGCLNSVAGCHNLSRTVFSLGKLIQDEVFAFNLQAWAKKHKAVQEALRIEATARRRNSSVKYRKQAVRSLAARAGFKNSVEWTRQEQVIAGQWLVEVALQVEDLFVLVRSNEEFDVAAPYLTITEEALTYSQEFVAKLLDRHPVPLPLISPPAPWTDLRLRVESNGKPYHLPIMRREHCKTTRAHLKQALESGAMKPVMDALSRIQSTGWAVNEPILDVVVWAQENSVEIEGLPPAKDVPLPGPISDETWASMPDDQKRLRRRDISEKVQKNRGFIGERETFKKDVETARYIMAHGNEFWTPVNMDYRGRVYSVCHFNFQRQDYVRALFRFADGKPLGPNGLYWLAIHLANCGDFDKVSKKPFEDRIAWVKENRDLIEATASQPTLCDEWHKADAPFLFLAACIEYRKAIQSGNPSSYVCHLPVSFDGSCSGLQHFAAMSRCEVTAPLVNLMATDRPSDVYQTVADAVKVKVEKIAASDDEFAQVARLALEYGVNRSLVKRNVMTWAYSSKKFGMTKQLMEDTMVPLRDAVTLGKIEKHPFAVEGEAYTGQQASKLLGHLSFDTIEETVTRPAEAMRFLQGIARALAHEGKPVVWHTPLGLPVVLIYPLQKVSQVRLYLHDRGVRVNANVNISEDQKGIDKNRAANAIAPGFVHSYDACHLHMVANGAAQAGIHSIALVHDSFGCHPSEADMFRKVIQDEFYRLYQGHDVLQMILEDACEQIHSNFHRLPTLPDKGAYNIEDVLHAQYAFA